MEREIVSSFMEITSCKSQAYAMQHLASCNWDLERSINIFYNAGFDAAAASTGVPAPASVAEEDNNAGSDAGTPPTGAVAAAPLPGAEEEKGDEVRAPIPARVEALYEDSYYVRRRRRAAGSVWEATPAPTPVPAVPVHTPSVSEIEATGWGDPDDGRNGGVAQVQEVNVVTGSQEAQDDDQEDDGSEDGDHGTNLDVEDDGEDGEEKNDDEEDNNAADSDYSIEDYGLEMDEDGYDGAMLEEENTSDAMERDDERQSSREANSLADLYRHPYELMFTGSFHEAKVHAARKDRFLLVNLQVRHEFMSHLHNRDLWPDKEVNQAVMDSFVFLLLERMNDYGDEGTKVCSFYKIGDDQLPAVLVLDPITGQLLAKLSGSIGPNAFMQFIDGYTKSKPSTLSKSKIVRRTAAVPESSASAGAGGEQEMATPPEGLIAAGADGEPQEQPMPESTSSSARAGGEEEPEPVTTKVKPPVEMAVDYDDEPMEGEKIYNLRVRFPDGKVVTKEFGCKRRVAALFAFCRSAVREDGETEQKAFRVMRLAGRAFGAIEDHGATFEELGLNCATVSVVFIT